MNDARDIARYIEEVDPERAIVVGTGVRVVGFTLVPRTKAFWCANESFDLVNAVNGGILSSHNESYREEVVASNRYK